MGLAVIVILIVFGFLFYVMFQAGKKETAYTQTFTDSKLAGDYLNTLMDIADPNCNHLNFRSMLAKCVFGDTNYECPTTGTHQKICPYVDEKLDAIFEGTLGDDRIKKDIYFYILNEEVTFTYDPPPGTPLTFGTPCPDDSGKTQGSALILSENNYEQATAILDICE